MKKIFANILAIAFIIAVQPVMAQKQQVHMTKWATAQTENKAKPGVTDKAQQPENKVAIARQAHYQKLQQKEYKPIVKPETKMVTATKVEEKPATEAPAMNKYDSTLCFPLKHDDIYSLYTYVIDLRDKKIISKYKAFFDRNNYEFTGYVWQGLLKQIINTADKRITENVFIKAQENMVCFTITSYEVKSDLPKFICPILSSPQLFASYVRRANREDINNY